MGTLLQLLSDICDFVCILSTQVRDGVTNASEAARCEAAVDDVTSHVTMTSRRLSDVTVGAHNLSTLVQQQLSDSVLDDIAAVNSYRRVFFHFFSQRILLFSIMYCGLLLCCRFFVK